MLVESDDELGSVARSLRSMAEHFRKVLDLLSQESSLRAVILDSMFEGVLAVEHNLRVTFFNHAFARAFRIAAPNAGQPVAQIVRDPALHALLSRVIRTRVPAREKMSLINAEGRIFEVQAVPLLDSGSAGAIATFHDITELERLERVRKDFVANISHELGTPLAAIQGYTETLRDGALEDPENSRRFLNIIISHTDRINRLASDLLMLSEIESGADPRSGRAHLRFGSSRKCASCGGGSRRGAARSRVSEYRRRCVRHGAQRAAGARNLQPAPECDQLQPSRRRSSNRRAARRRHRANLRHGHRDWNLHPGYFCASSSASIGSIKPALAIPAARVWAYRS